MLFATWRYPRLLLAFNTHGLSVWVGQCGFAPPFLQHLYPSPVKQDSWAIAKKTARCAQYMGALKSIESPHYAPDYTFPEICNGLLFRSILRMCVQNLKFVALPVPEIIGGTQKIWAVPGYAHAPLSPKILKGFCSHGHCECEYTCQIWSP